MKNWLIGKDPDAGEDCSRKEKGMTKDDMVGWHDQLYGHEFELALEVGDRQGSLVCCSSWGCKESDMTEQLNWTELMLGKIDSKRRREWQRMRWFNIFTDSMDMNLCKLQETVEDRGAWCVPVHWVTKNRTWLINWTELNTWEAKYYMSTYNYGTSLVAQMIKNLPRMLWPT